MFRLALALGRTVRELGEMPHAEFVEWQAFYQLEPFGDRMTQMATAHGAAAMVAAHGVSGARALSIVPWLDEDAALLALADVDPDAHSDALDRLFGF